MSAGNPDQKVYVYAVFSSLKLTCHLEYFFQFFELSTKAASTKAAFDTPRGLGHPGKNPGHPGLPPSKPKEKNFRGRALSGPVRDTPPYRAIPFRDSIAEGGIAPICLVS